MYKKIRNGAASGRNDEPMDKMTMKYQFFVIPAKTFGFLSKPPRLNEFQI